MVILLSHHRWTCQSPLALCVRESHLRRAVLDALSQMKPFQAKFERFVRLLISHCSSCIDLKPKACPRLELGLYHSEGERISMRSLPSSFFPSFKVPSPFPSPSPLCISLPSSPPLFQLPIVCCKCWPLHYDSPAGNGYVHSTECPKCIRKFSVHQKSMALIHRLAAVTLTPSAATSRCCHTGTAGDCHTYKMGPLDRIFAQNCREPLF